MDPGAERRGRQSEVASRLVRRVQWQLAGIPASVEVDFSLGQQLSAPQSSDRTGHPAVESEVVEAVPHRFVGDLELVTQFRGQLPYDLVDYRLQPHPGAQCLLGLIGVVTNPILQPRRHQPSGHQETRRELVGLNLEPSLIPVAELAQHYDPSVDRPELNRAQPVTVKDDMCDLVREGESVAVEVVVEDPAIDEDLTCPAETAVRLDPARPELVDRRDGQPHVQLEGLHVDGRCAIQSVASQQLEGLLFDLVVGYPWDAQLRDLRPPDLLGQRSELVLAKRFTTERSEHDRQPGDELLIVQDVRRDLAPT